MRIMIKEQTVMPNATAPAMPIAMAVEVELVTAPERISVECEIRIGYI